jgi:hypothetical protein
MGRKKVTPTGRASKPPASNQHRRTRAAPQDQALRAALLAPVLTAATRPPGWIYAPGRKNAPAPNQRTGRKAPRALRFYRRRPPWPDHRPYLRAAVRSEVRRRHAWFRCCLGSLILAGCHASIVITNPPRPSSLNSCSASHGRSGVVRPNTTSSSGASVTIGRRKFQSTTPRWRCSRHGLAMSSMSYSARADHSESRPSLMELLR